MVLRPIDYFLAAWFVLAFASTLYVGSVRVRFAVLLGTALMFSPALSRPAAIAFTVDPDRQRHLGVETIRLTAATHAVEIDAFVTVLDPAPFVRLNSELASAEAAATASSAEARRASTLGRDQAAMVTDLAKAKARINRIHVEYLRRRLGLEWTPPMARLNPIERGRLALGLSAGTIALLRLDTPKSAGQAGARTVKIDIGANSVLGAVVGPARVAVPRLRSSGLIVELSGPKAMSLAAGLRLSAHIETAVEEKGVVLPRSAVFEYEGAQWAYVRSPAGDFQRRFLPNPTLGPDGFFVARDFAPSEQVVNRGANALFAVEMSRGRSPD
jgi:hypothetical protein